MTKLFPKNPIQYVRVNDCEVIWEEAQRERRNTLVRRIIDNFDPEIFGVLTVTAKNGIDKHHVIDGQGRVIALKEMGYGDQLVPAVVKDVHDAKGAAKMFDGINSGEKPQAIDRFKVRVTAGYEAENDLNDLVRALGYRIAANGDPGTISAVAALTTVQKKYGLSTLRAALEIIQATWKMDRDAVHGAIIQGYSKLVADHGNVIDRKRLVSKIGKKYTAANLLAAAKGNRMAMSGTMPANVLFVVALSYNQGLRVGSRIELDA